MSDPSVNERAAKDKPDAPGWYECRHQGNPVDWRIAMWWSGCGLHQSPREGADYAVGNYTDFNLIGATIDLQSAVKDLSMYACETHSTKAVYRADIEEILRRYLVPAPGYAELRAAVEAASYYLHQLPKDGRTYEAWQFAVQLDAGLAALEPRKEVS